MRHSRARPREWIRLLEFYHARNERLGKLCSGATKLPSLKVANRVTPRSMPIALMEDSRIGADAAAADVASRRRRSSTQCCAAKLADIQ
jgi:hypothetical protein